MFFRPKTIHKNGVLFFRKIAQMYQNLIILLLVVAVRADWLVWQQCYDGDNLEHFQTYPVLMYMNGNCVPDLSSKSNTYFKINQTNPGTWSEWTCYDQGCGYCVLKDQPWNKLSNDSYRKMPCKDRLEKKYYLYLDQNEMPDHNDYSEPIDEKINHWHLKANYPPGTTICEWNTAHNIHAYPPGHSLIFHEERIYCEASQCSSYYTIDTFSTVGDITPCPMKNIRFHSIFMQPNMCVVQEDNSVTLQQCTGMTPDP